MPKTRMTAIEVKGLDQVRAALEKLPNKLAERVGRMILRQGANDMARKIRAAAPVKTGRLRKAIKVRGSKIHRLNKNGNVGVYITINPGKSRKDQNGAWYGKFVEYGYNHGSKQVTGRQAVTLGIISREQLAAKRALVASHRRVGRVKAGIRYRHGGKAVAGQHFVRNTFNANAEQAAQKIISASQAAAESIAKQLGF